MSDDRRSDTERRASELRRLQDEMQMDELREQRAQNRRRERNAERREWLLIASIFAAILSGTETVQNAALGILLQVMGGP